MSEIGGEKRENPLLLLLLSLLLPSFADSLSYECKDNQVLVVQSFGNDTIRMHCQLLQLCGYEKLECEYDHNQPKCGGQTNFVAAVQQPATSAEVEHRCCNLFNGRSPHMIPTHTGNDCFIYELPDGSGAGKKEGEEKLEGTPEGPAEEAPLAILKSASEIPEQIDGVSGYRLRLFLLRNKSPPTLLVKGIERRADGYRITICRPQCVAPEEAERSPLVAAGTPEGWKAISWSSWSTNTWTSWARSRFGAAAAAAGAAGAARKRTSISTGSDGNGTKAAAISDGAAASAAASASASVAREGSGGTGGGNEQKQGNINIFIHTGDAGRRKRIGSDSDEGRHGSGRGRWTSGDSKEDELLRELEEATRKIHQQREREKRRREKEKEEEEAERKRELEEEEEKRRREREREEEAERKRVREEVEAKRKDEKERELREKERKRKEEEEKRKEKEREDKAKELKKTDEARLEELRRNELESKKKKENTISGKKPNGSQKEEEEIIEETEENIRIKKKEEEEEEEIIEVVEEKGKGKKDEKKIKEEDKKKGGGKGVGVDEEVVLVEETEIVRKGERREPPKDVNQEEVAEGDEDDNARDDDEGEVETTPTVTASTAAATTARAAAETASSTPSTRMSSAASTASTAAATTPAPTPPPAADSPSRDAPASPPQEQPASGMARAVQAMNCFSGDSLVSTITGTKRMRDLQVGDFVLVPAAGNVQKYEAVEMFYHREPSRKTSFVQILTANGRRISLTPLHLLPFGDCDTLQRSLEKMEGLEETLGASRFAYKALPGDCLLTLGSDGVFHADPIVKVGRQVSEGIFSPMTVEGSLVVDGVVASCFSQLESHSLHKIIFDLLLRIQSWLSYQPAFSPSPDLAIPSFINYVHKLSHYVLPFATF